MSSGTDSLAQSTSNFTQRAEDAAAGALEQILSNSGAARAALADTLREGGTTVDSIAEVRTQAVGEASNAPFFVCLDDSGAERVLIVAKSWADLAPDQPNAYLKRLKEQARSRPVAVLFVAPAARLEALWGELNLQADREFQLFVVTTPTGLHAATVAGGDRRLMLTSWAKLLDLMEWKANRAADWTAKEKIRQLRELGDRMDGDALSP